MAIAEDPAIVLEQFIHDVANLPAEISHLYEEMQAKESQIAECRQVITQRDNSLQKFVKLNGSLLKNPKEEPYAKTILEKFEKAELLQSEKIGLAEKAAVLLDRHIKRLDIKIRDLQNDGALPADPDLPSLLHDSPGNLAPIHSHNNTGMSTPLHMLSGSTTGGAPNLAHAAVARLQNAAGGRSPAPGTLGLSTNGLASQSHLANPSALAALSMNNQRAREMSVGSETKRRRLNASLGSLPASHLARPSSVGPGTPRPSGASTPGAGGSGGSGSTRAGSVGAKSVNRKAHLKKLSASQQQQQLRRKAAKTMNKKARRLLHGSGSRGSPSTTTTNDDDSALDSDDVGSDEEDDGSGGGGAGAGTTTMTGGMDGLDGGAGGAAAGGGGGGGRGRGPGGDVDEEGAEGEEDGDDTKYCFCKAVSYGDMVACDNDLCPYQWFHWECVGLKEEPVGDWLCPECIKQKGRVKKSR